MDYLKSKVVKEDPDITPSSEEESEAEDMDSEESGEGRKQDEEELLSHKKAADSGVAAKGLPDEKVKGQEAGKKKLKATAQVCLNLNLDQALHSLRSNIMGLAWLTFPF